MTLLATVRFLNAMLASSTSSSPTFKSWLTPSICLWIYVWVWSGAVHSAPLEKERGNGDPVWSHGESYAFASATGDGAVLETDSWTEVNNNGGLHVNNVTSDGTVIGYQVSGMTNCSQESYAYAAGSWSANALAYGLCNSSVLLDKPVTNTGTGYSRTDELVLA